MLDCKSAGWFPEPQLFWLDGEGNVLPAGPPETSRGPDGLYSVSSRVTVEKRHKNNFTCRVQQKDMNQSRETHVHVPDQFFMVHSKNSVPVILAVVLCFILIVAVVVFIWRWRQRKISTEKQAENKNEEQGHLMDEERSKHEEELLRIKIKDEEYLKHNFDVFMKIKEKLEELKKQRTVLQEEEEKEFEENDKMFKEVEFKIKNPKNGNVLINAKDHEKLKEFMKQHNNKLDERKRKHEALDVNTDQLINKVRTEIKMIERKKQEQRKIKETDEQLKKSETEENI
ncbi:butyrophilin subfamily 2 member A2 [Nematolebias whitei]|uniref:butyrophilin subfamily 2 member A2 n=1 Tax=Nematolebias whitei TaxID=451745 RepID=UPI00189C2780|nr:butyrophilin subfamily 2 member A2 [Nematolebias whitei]